ncbi:hypothetical protein I4U23_022450 [Adineta vaga]|nr:hypothetical protein I4U23_022450 [Adineta vaga]
MVENFQYNSLSDNINDKGKRKKIFDLIKVPMTFLFTRNESYMKFSLLLMLFLCILYFYTTHIVDFNKRYSIVSHVNFSKQSDTIISNSLQWCRKNPFIIGYNKQLVLDFEYKHYLWTQDEFSKTFDFIKKYVLSPNETKGEFPKILYPTADLLACPYNNNHMKRYGLPDDTGKLLCGLEILSSDDSCTVYSLGSGNDFRFEESILAQTKCTVYTFDCTSFPPQTKYDRLHFYKICLGENSPMQRYIYPESGKYLDNPLLTIMTYMSFDQIMKINNHNQIHVLKMDIEGGEYSAFRDLLKNDTKQNLPYQISFESHWWHRDAYHSILHISLFSQLWKSGYRLLQYELNKHDHSCVEWTFMRMFC